MTKYTDDEIAKKRDEIRENIEIKECFYNQKILNCIFTYDNKKLKVDSVILNNRNLFGEFCQNNKINFISSFDRAIFNTVLAEEITLKNSDCEIKELFEGCKWEKNNKGILDYINSDDSRYIEKEYPPFAQKRYF